jgi:hypothetical protein
VLLKIPVLEHEEERGEKHEERKRGGYMEGMERERERGGERGRERGRERETKVRAREIIFRGYKDMKDKVLYTTTTVKTPQQQ